MIKKNIYTNIPQDSPLYDSVYVSKNKQKTLFWNETDRLIILH